MVDALVARLLKPRLKPPSPARLSAEETQLLQEINRGLPESEWLRYRHLIGKRNAETLTPAEHGELIELSDEIEVIHAERLEALRLNRRGVVNLRRLMQRPIGTAGDTDATEIRQPGSNL